MSSSNIRTAYEYAYRPSELIQLLSDKVQRTNARIVDLEQDLASINGLIATASHRQAFDAPIDDRNRLQERLQEQQTNKKICEALIEEMRRVPKWKFWVTFRLTLEDLIWVRF